MPLADAIVHIKPWSVHDYWLLVARPVWRRTRVAVSHLRRREYRRADIPGPRKFFPV